MSASQCLMSVTAAQASACPQRSEDSRLHAQRYAAIALVAINFGGYCGAYPSSVPVGNTGTTSTGRDL